MDGVALVVLLVLVLVVGGDMTRRKHRTLQSKHVRGADDKPVISPVSWGPGFLSLYKGTSILLMFASKHLSPPSSVLFAPCGWEPVLAANITE